MTSITKLAEINLSGCRIDTYVVLDKLTLIETCEHCEAKKTNYEATWTVVIILPEPTHPGGNRNLISRIAMLGNVRLKLIISHTDAS